VAVPLVRRSGILVRLGGCWMPGVGGSGSGRAASGLAIGCDGGFLLLREFADAVSFAERRQNRRSVGRGEMEQAHPAEGPLRGNGGGEGAVGLGVAGDAVWPVAEQDGRHARAAATSCLFTGIGYSDLSRYPEWNSYS
jgi:hypothetical protein